MKIVLIGSGNVAFHLGPILKNTGHSIVQIYNHQKKTGEPLAKILKCDLITNPERINPNADVYIVSLKDEVLGSFLKKVSFNPKLILHTSGTIGLDVFPRRMTSTGVIYPLQTFSKKSNKAPETIPLCIEGNNDKSTSKIRRLARSISSLVFVYNSDQRKLIHLAAVFANNFTNHLFTLSGKLLKSKNIPFELLLPLISETFNKIKSEEPEVVQSGPARRGDKLVIKKHLDLIAGNKELKEIYKQFTKSIAHHYKTKI